MQARSHMHTKDAQLSWLTEGDSIKMSSAYNVIQQLLINAFTGNKVDRDKLSNSRCCRFFAKIGNKVERIRQQSTLFPIWCRFRQQSTFNKVDRVEFNFVAGSPFRCRSGSHNFTCKQHHACFCLVNVHQMAPPLTVVADIQLQQSSKVSSLRYLCVQQSAEMFNQGQNCLTRRRCPCRFLRFVIVHLSSPSTLPRRWSPYLQRPVWPRDVDQRQIRRKSYATDV